mgnify:CR=1 FL=1
MDMKTHIVRAVKYLIWLALLFTLVFALMISTGTSRVGASCWPCFTLASASRGEASGPI